MIQWIALAMAADAESRASDAQETADAAMYKARSGPAQLVTIHDFDLHTVLVDDSIKGFWKRLFAAKKEVLEKEPAFKVTIKTSDILNIKEAKDDDGATYVQLKISQYACVRKSEFSSNIVNMLFVPGTLEEVTAILSGKKPKLNKATKALLARTRR